MTNSIYFKNYRYVDLNEEPIERTPQTHSYSYDGYVTYRAGTNKEIESECYSDRMKQWDYEKYQQTKKKFLGQSDWLNEYPIEKIEQFLSVYFDKNIKLVVMMQHCNVSNGFPLWSFHYKTIKTN